MTNPARAIRRPRVNVPPVPQALTLGIASLMLGVLLDQLWPQQLFFISIRLGLGPVLILLGLALAAVALVPSLFRKDAQHWRKLARHAEDRAGKWEQRARAQEAGHTRFMRELEHELKNPLQAMKSALAELDGVGTNSDSIRTASAQVDRLRQLTSSLREVANVAPEKLQLAKVDLDELVTESVELARAANPNSAARIRVSAQRIPWRPAPVIADGELLSLAIYNLLDNALKYSAADRPVEVRLQENGKRASIEVADVGGGIDPKDLPHVTEELYRGDRTDGIEGSGLGLALVQRVALAHNGELTLRSRPNEGTIARLELPLA